MAAGGSAVSMLSLLDEPEQALKAYALQQLNVLVPEFWPGGEHSTQQHNTHDTRHNTGAVCAFRRFLLGVVCGRCTFLRPSGGSLWFGGL